MESKIDWVYAGLLNRAHFQVSGSIPVLSSIGVSSGVGAVALTHVHESSSLSTPSTNYSRRHLVHKITLVVGDWSGDGHDKSATYIIESNLDLEQLSAAYKAGVKLLGTDLVEDTCSDYEDNSFPVEVFNKLQALLVPHKVQLDLDEDYIEAEVEFRVYDSEIWVDLILGVCKLGNPSLEWSLIDPDASWHIGGYGLFY